MSCRILIYGYPLNLNYEIPLLMINIIPDPVDR
jgi:hypothetical protein